MGEGYGSNQADLIRYKPLEMEIVRPVVILPKENPYIYIYILACVS